MLSCSPDPSNAAVTLDLWLTLIAEPTTGASFSQDRRRIRVDNAIDALAGLGKVLERTQLAAAFDAATAEINCGHARGTDMNFHDRIVRTLASIDENLPVEIGVSGVRQVAQAVDAAFDRWPPALLPGALQTLDSLSSMGVKLALISNTGFSSGSAYYRFLNSTGLDAFFEVITLSGDAEVAKPSPEIFTGTLESLGVDPGRAIHVGDNPVADVAGAAAIGMATVWISGSGSPALTAKPDYIVTDVGETPLAVADWLAKRVNIAT